MIHAIEIIDVTKRYGDLQALAGVSLSVEPGEFFGLLGPNGAGKTTLISILAGLSRATSGLVRIMGHDVTSGYRGARSALGVVPQELVFDPFFTVRETLTFQSGYFGLRDNGAWIDEVLENLDLTAKANTNMRALSGGMKRRVLVAQALVHKPPVIVLDEPTAGVDVELRQTLWQFIARLNKLGHTVLLTTHYLEEAEALCGRIAMLKAGRVIALDRTSELLKAASGNVLRFKIDGELPPDLAQRARITGRIVQFPARDALDIETYLGAVRQAGLLAQDIEVRKADLEDVFRALMGQQNEGGAAATPAP